MPVSTLTDTSILVPAIGGAFRKLNPRHMISSPVMFVVEIVASLTTVLFMRDLVTGAGDLGFAFQINVWLWFTVLFANFAEAVAEGRGKAQAASLRRTKTEANAKLLEKGATQLAYRAGHGAQAGRHRARRSGRSDPQRRRRDRRRGLRQRSGDHGQIRAGHPRIRRRPFGVTGGTTVISDWIKVKITAAQGSTFLDRMIALVEGAERQKTPNEIALNILLAGMTIIFVFAVATIPSFAHYAGGNISVLVLVALFVTLIPTTIGALLSAIGIAGMDRLVRFNVLAMSGRAVEAAGDVDTLLLDKTGTITLGNRQATEFLPRVRRQRTRSGRCGAAGLALGRDAGRPLDRGAGEGEIWPARPRDGADARELHSLLGADAHQRRRSRRLVHPQGRGRRGARLGRASRRRRRN